MEANYIPLFNELTRLYNWEKTFKTQNPIIRRNPYIGLFNYDN